MTPDRPQRCAATERNAGPILEVLRRLLPAQARVLEVASGTGQHAVHFARELPGLDWQPSDPDPACRASINAWREATEVTNVTAPIDLDVRDLPWSAQPVDAVFVANLLHVAPADILEPLMRGSAGVLRPGGQLLIYGPFRVGGEHTAASNARFDRALRRENPQWGLRDVDDVQVAARAVGLQQVEAVTMPANNLLLGFRR